MPMPELADVAFEGLKDLATVRELTAKELGELADLHLRCKTERLRLDKESKMVDEIEKGTEKLLVDQMLKQKVSAAGGQKLRVSMNPVKHRPHVTDWTEFYKFILKTEDFSLLERRPSASAVAERWDDSVIVPGVEKFPVYTLSKSVVK